MSSKARALIERMEIINAEVIQLAEACSDDEWQMPVVDEDGRPVGVVFHHIGWAYDGITQWAKQIGSGGSPPPMTREELNALNAHFAQEHMNTSQAETIAYLQEVTEDTAVKLQSLNDEQLNRAAPLSLAGGKEFSGASLLEAFAIDHAKRHLAAIKATLLEKA